MTPVRNNMEPKKTSSLQGSAFGSQTQDPCLGLVCRGVNAPQPHSILVISALVYLSMCPQNPCMNNHKASCSQHTCSALTAASAIPDKAMGPECIRHSLLGRVGGWALLTSKPYHNPNIAALAAHIQKKQQAQQHLLGQGRSIRV